MTATSAPRVYWTCQLSGWGLYTLVNLAFFAASGPPSARMVLLTLGLGALGLAATHALRTFARHRGWARLGLGPLMPRVVAASLALAFATQLVMFALALLAHLYSWSEAKVGGLLFQVAQSSILYVLWQAIYFGFHAFERSHRAELASVKSASAAQSAELRALRDQLNPHFLFNALNTVRGLITEDPARARDAVTRLSGLLRYTLTSGEAQTVPLARELDAVRDYLALEALRFEERLTVEVEVPDSCLTTPVPVMLVQTLVENAVKHGIARCTSGGALRLVARRRAGAVCIEVSNPSPTSAASGESGAGLGLANARERLRLICGEEATLTLETSGPVTTAEVTIPCP